MFKFVLSSIVLFACIYPLTIVAVNSAIDKIPLPVESGTKPEPMQWGTKRQRTVRHEVENEPTDHQTDSNLSSKKSHVRGPKTLLDESGNCIIHRSGCSHWKSMKQSEKNTEAGRYFLYRQTPEERLKYQESARERYRKRYREMDPNDKAEQIRIMNDKKWKKISKLSLEEQEEFRMKQSASHERHRKRKSVSPIHQFLSLSSSNQNLEVSNSPIITVSRGIKGKKNSQNGAQNRSFQTSLINPEVSDPNPAIEQDLGHPFKKTKKPGKKRDKGVSTLLDNSGNCIIHRPGCDHWSKLEDDERKRESNRYFTWKLTPEGLEKQREATRERSKERWKFMDPKRRAKLIERSNSQQAKRKSKMSIEDQQKSRIKKNAAIYKHKDRKKANQHIREYNKVARRWKE